MSVDAENEFFSDGITEELINALCQIPNINVIARTSSFAFKGVHDDVRTIGQKLSVDSVIEGSVRKFKNKVRITAQLIDVNDGYSVWSATYNRELEDLFEVQDEISLLIADQIRENYGHIEIDEKDIKHQATRISEYERFLKARYYVQSFKQEDILKGIDLLKDIIKVVPEYAPAYQSLHYGYNVLAAAGMMDATEAFSIATNYLNTALRLDPDLPEVHHSLGWAALNNDWDFKKALIHLEKALELRPAYAEAHQKISITLALQGQLKQANKHILIALKQDPLDPLNYYFLGYYKYLEKGTEDALANLFECLKMNKQFEVAYSIIINCYIYQKNIEGLARFIEQYVVLNQDNVDITFGKTALAYLQGNHTSYQQFYKELNSSRYDSNAQRRNYFNIILLCLEANYDDAIALVKAGVDAKEPLMTLLREDPLLEPLKDFDFYNHLMDFVFAKPSDLYTEPVQVQKQSLLNKDEIEVLEKALEQELNNNQIYLNNTLTLRGLAELVNVHPNRLSWYINEIKGKNFNEFINSYRLESFKVKALLKENQHLTLLAIAYESGFNSKTVFNAFFKKELNQTPLAWLKEQKRVSSN